MKNKLNLSGIGLGLYIIGLGLCYILQQTSNLHIMGFWLRLYPILIILLGLDFILANTNRTTSFFTKPSPLVITLIIIFTIIGAVANFFIRNQPLDITRFRHFDGFENGFFDWEQAPQFTVNQNFKLPSGIKTVKIVNQSGDIHVNTGIDDTVSAEAQIKVRSHHNLLSKNLFKLTGDVQGDTFTIELDSSGRLGAFNHNIHSNIIVNIPGGLSVAVENSAGNVEVASITNNLNVETKSGNIQIKNVGRDLKLSTMFGNVTIDCVNGNAEISTKAGEIEIKKIVGTAYIDSISGDVTLSECNGPLHVELKSGNLEVNFTKISDNCDLDLKSGNIQLGLPSSAKFTLDAQSMSGNINSDFEEIAITKEFAKVTANGNINGGGPLVRIRDISGNIDLQTY
jgi:hypothetical protein